MRKSILLTAPLLALFGCDANSDSQSQAPLTSDRASAQAFEGDVLDSSRQLDDPYTVENMRRAVDSLAKSEPAIAARSSMIASEIRPNALYVRFLPRGKRQKDALRKAMRDIPMFDHPLDYKTVNRWKDWVDASLPDSTFAYYATVPVDFDFIDSIPYQRIKSLFLVQPVLASQDEESNAPFAGRAATVQTNASALLTSGIDLVQLEHVSRQITGNEDASSEVAGRKASWYSKWRPTGTITYQDGVLGTKPVVGVRVTAGYSYYWRSSTTDGNGYFSSPERWYWSCEYELHWDTDNFLMEDGNSWYGEDLMIQGPTNYSAWKKHLTGKDAAHAAVFMGARNYYYGDIGGLNRPRLNGWTSLCIDLQIYDSNHPDSKLASYEYAYTLATWAEYINIWLKSGDKYMGSDRLYGSTVHELTHCSHYDNFQTRFFWNSRGGEFAEKMDKALKETWARGVERFLTRKVYPAYSVSCNNQYTGIVEDLMDANGTYANASGSGDAVSGFTITQIQSQLLKSFYLDELRQNLSSAYPSGSDGRSYTETSMTNLFKHWTTISGWH